MPASRDDQPGDDAHGERRSQRSGQSLPERSPASPQPELLENSHLIAAIRSQRKPQLGHGETFAHLPELGTIDDRPGCSGVEPDGPTGAVLALMNTYGHRLVSPNGLPRLRQVALATKDLAATSDRLQRSFGWEDPFHDPGVGAFGLENAVFAVGDTFVEVVAPVRENTTAGRYIESRGGDTGYMAIFQVEELEGARARIDAAGIRTVWKSDLADIAGTHLHPKDVPGAIVSIDWADPPGSWRWAGPSWTGTAATRSAGGITGITVEVEDPLAAAERWALAVGVEWTKEGAGAVISLFDAKQELRFVTLEGVHAGGINEIRLSGCAPKVDAVIGGVRFVCEEAWR
jgi:hypothetical protein